MIRPLIYKKQCIICDEPFVAKRLHAETCSARCRFILYKLKQNYLEFAGMTGYPLYKLSITDLRVQREIVGKGNLLDDKGNIKDLIGGYCDGKGVLKIAIFRIKAQGYLEVWNDYEDDMILKYFKYA